MAYEFYMSLNLYFLELRTHMMRESKGSPGWTMRRWGMGGCALTPREVFVPEGGWGLRKRIQTSSSCNVGLRSENMAHTLVSRTLGRNSYLCDLGQVTMSLSLSCSICKMAISSSSGQIKGEVCLSNHSLTSNISISCV